MGIRLRVTEARIAFCDSLFEPKPFDEDGVPRRSAVFIVQPNRKYVELDQGGAETGRKVSIEEAIDEVGREGFKDKWPANKKAWANNNNKMCYYDGDTKPYDGFAGNWALSAHRSEKQGPVTVIDNLGRPLSEKDGVIYGGCYVTGSVEIYAQTRNYPGIRCGLRGVRFEKPGDAFGAGAPASPEEFGEVQVPEGAEDDLV